MARTKYCKKTSQDYWREDVDDILEKLDAAGVVLLKYPQHEYVEAGRKDPAIFPCMMEQDAQTTLSESNTAIPAQRIHGVRLVYTIGRGMQMPLRADILKVKNCSHPNVVDFLEPMDSTFKDGAFYTIPTPPGGDLLQLYNKWHTNKLPEVLLAHVFAGIMSGLHFLHSGLHAGNQQNALVAGVRMNTVRIELIQGNEKSGYPSVKLADFGRIQNPGNVSHRSWIDMKWQVESPFEAAMAFDVMQAAEVVHNIAHGQQYREEQTTCDCAKRRKHSPAFENLLDQAVKNFKTSAELVGPLESLASQLRQQSPHLALPSSVLKEFATNKPPDNVVRERIDEYFTRKSSTSLDSEQRDVDEDGDTNMGQEDQDDEEITIPKRAQTAPPTFN